MINYKQNIKDFFFIKRDSFKSFNFTTILIFSIFQFFNLPISSQTTIDQQTYNYNTSNNQLTSITDTKLAGLSVDDIDNQSLTNYVHNANGQLTQDEAEGIVDIQWAVSGKVRKVFIDDDKDGTVDRTLSFLYDAMGFRVKKTETVLATLTSPAIVSHTFYSRNATGELVALYEKDEAGNIKRKEVTISIGSDKTEVDPTLVASSTTTNVYTRTLANKYFELKDQLGTVRTVVNNVKEDDGTGSFKATIKSTSDNYAFGMELPNRTFHTSNYRYGFQGKEKDSDIKGNGKSYDFGARLYDPRVGKWLSTDPLSDNFPSVSSYNFCLNNPIIYVDPNGKSAIIFLTLLDMIRNSGCPLENNNQLVLAYYNASHEFCWAIIEPDEIDMASVGITGAAGLDPIPGDEIAVGAGLLTYAVIRRTARVEEAFAAARKAYNNLTRSPTPNISEVSKIVKEVKTIRGKPLIKSEKDLPRKQDGYVRLYRGTSNPNEIQIAPAWRGKSESEIPLEDTRFLSSDEVNAHVNGGWYDSENNFVPGTGDFRNGDRPQPSGWIGVSTSTDYSSAVNAGGSHIVVYEISVEQYEQMGKFGNYDVIFRGSIPEKYRVGTIEK